MENIIPLHDVEFVYEIPLYLETLNVAQNILKHFKMKIEEPNLDKWISFINKIKSPKEINKVIGMIGKYTEFEDAYKSIKEALFISSIYENMTIELKWISSENINSKNVKSKLDRLDGIVILPGFGLRGFEGKIEVAIYSRENDIPTLGICLGMQVMTIAQARKIGYKNATSEEISNKGEMIFNLINKNVGLLGGTLRLGGSEIIFKDGTLFKKIYGKKSAIERHRHRYEVNKKYKNILEVENFIFSGLDKNTNLIETCEVSNKKFYLGTQYHPEFNATPLKPHPLFTSFLKSCK